MKRKYAAFATKKTHRPVGARSKKHRRRLLMMAVFILGIVCVGAFCALHEGHFFLGLGILCGLPSLIWILSIEISEYNYIEGPDSETLRILKNSESLRYNPQDVRIPESEEAEDGTEQNVSLDNHA